MVDVSTLLFDFRSATRRLVSRILAVVALGLVASTAPAASAASCERVTVVSAGPYRVVVHAASFANGQGAELAVRASITDAATGAAVTYAHLSVLVDGRPGHAYVAAGIGGTYSLFIPIRSPGAWRSLGFTIVIDGPKGPAAARYVPVGLQRQGLREPWAPTAGPGAFAGPRLDEKV